MNLKIYLAVLFAPLLTACESPIIIPKENEGGTANSNFSGHEMPEEFRPNDATISLVEKRKLRWLKSREIQKRIIYIDPVDTHHSITTLNNDENAHLEQELNTGYMLSYLFFDKGSIKYDGVAAKGRFSNDITDSTFMWNYSSGKGITSYLVGHAICDGYIDSIYDPIDWPMMKNTVYGKQVLKDLLDMYAGDSHLVNDSFILHPETKGVSHRDMGFNQVAHYLRDTSPQHKREVFYNNVVQDVVANYLAYKIGDEYLDFLRELFQNHVRIENKMFIELRPKTYYGGEDNNLPGGSLQTRIAGDFYFTRKDFLRVGIAMMRDYQENTCVGQYLKTIQSEARRWTRYEPSSRKSYSHPSYYAHKYGGMMYFDYDGLRGRNIFGLEGRLGNGMMIDMDNSVIIAVHTAAKAVDLKFFMIDAMREGSLVE